MKNLNSKKSFRTLLAIALALACLPVRGQADAPETNSVAQTNPPPVTPVEEPAVWETNVIVKGSSTTTSIRRHVKRGQDLVVFGRTVEVKAGETVNDLVVIGGSAIVNGTVERDAVVIFGTVTVNGEVKRDAVAVLGNIRVGTNSTVRSDAVAVAGNVRLASGAKVGGDAVAVGGSVERSEGDNIGGDVVGLGGLPVLGDWLEQCVFKLRPLAPQVGWVWVVAGVFALIYFLVALGFPWPVKVCVNELSTRPATTFLVGLLVKLLVPLVVLVLAATGVGLLAVPFLFVALFVAAIFGKVALIEYLGAGLGRMFGFEMLSKPLVAFLLGLVLITLLYLVPVLGFVMFAIAGVWSLGAAVTALFVGMGRERKPPTPGSFPGAPSGGNPASSGGPSGMSSAFASAPISGLSGEGNSPAAAPAAESLRPNGLPAVLACPRAGFWERMGAAFLDIMLLCIPAALVGPFVVFIALAYFAGMWAWKGTTIGGIVLKLQVVRYDGGSLTFPVALVRGLAAAFSALVMLLGFFWIGWDRDKQGWHDKIAGTVVVRLPHSMPLICL